MENHSSLTLADIAKAAHVSVSTVSRVLNQREGSIPISQTTVERVREAARRLGYSPNPFAAALRTQRTGVLGAILRDLGDPFLSVLVRALQRAAHQEGFDLLVGHAASDPSTAERHLAFLLNPWFDGLFLLGNLPGDALLLQMLTQRPRPCVAVACGTQMALPAVVIDEEAGTQLALDYLYQLGHRRIAFLGNLEHAGVRERLVCFQRFVQERNLEWQEYYAQHCHSSRSNAAAHVRHFLALSEPPTALFCASDLLALGAMSGAWQVGRTVPEDLSILGFDDIEEAAEGFPSLTTVRQPVEMMADHATRLIHRLIEGGLPKEDTCRVIVQPELILRQSCAAPRV
ncbi:LacI family transcriptional regulator [Ktedonobacter sp. SOSP1-52]|uniref:LacI family DNA-binding transcriptional regulator n=1 Tax=Ktedonobacter sp. SOSP1-52 TaxID=2778366 RepID=UPI0019155B83|nr:LacI family DNA-binding transcriptional regulator [Ktedonobacter sp. SOSP1-52]GHO70006.1 LacI family transcriptional regulator [Ktedonobacter sp. SOSP1-52]